MATLYLYCQSKGKQMRTITCFIFSIAINSCGGKSNGRGGAVSPPMVPPNPTDEVETCVKSKTNLTSDLQLLEKQMSNFKNAKDVAHGLLRASCSKN